MKVESALKAGAINSHRCSNLSGLLTTPSVCIKAVLEHTLVPDPREHQENGIVLQKVVCCYKNGEKRAITNRRETDHHNT